MLLLASNNSIRVLIRRCSLPALWIDDIAPVKITAPQALNEHLRGCRIGCKRDLILIAQAFDLVDIVKSAGV